MLSFQPGLRDNNDFRVGRKMATFQLFFQSREQVVVQRGQRIGWMIKTLEAQVGQFLLACKCPVSRGIVVQEQDNPGVLIILFVFLCKNPKIFAEFTVICWWIVRYDNTYFIDVPFFDLLRDKRKFNFYVCTYADLNILISSSEIF